MKQKLFISILLALIVAGSLLWSGTTQSGGVVRVIFGSFFLLFLPGWWITMVAFDEKEIDILERFALSFGLSIAVVPLVVFYLNLVGLPITEWLVWGVVVGVILVCVIWEKVKRSRG